MKVSICQFHPKFGQVEENLKRVEHLVGRKKMDLLVLPELFATGYLFISRSELAHFAESVPSGPTTKYLTDLAVKTGAVIVAGLPERSGNKIYNSAVIVSPRGFIGRYRKIHLFDREKILFDPGNLPLSVFNLGFAKIGVMICFDWFFPEASRVLMLKGAQVICQCANLVLPWCQAGARIRALENRLFFVTANRNGEERRGGRLLKFTGRSQIVSPVAKVILQFSPREECVKGININPKEADNKNVTEYNKVTADRKPSLYQELLR